MQSFLGFHSAGCDDDDEETVCGAIYEYLHTANPPKNSSSHPLKLWEGGLFTVNEKVFHFSGKGLKPRVPYSQCKKSFPISVEKILRGGCRIQSLCPRQFLPDAQTALNTRARQEDASQEMRVLRTNREGVEKLVTECHCHGMMVSKLTVIHVVKCSV